MLLPSTVLPPCIPPFHPFLPLVSYPKASSHSSALAHLACALPPSTTPTHSLFVACAPTHTLHQHTCLHSPTWLVHPVVFYPHRFSTIPSPHHLVFAFLHTRGLLRLHSTPSRGVSCLALRLRCASNVKKVVRHKSLLLYHFVTPCPPRELSSHAIDAVITHSKFSPCVSQ